MKDHSNNIYVIFGDHRSGIWDKESGHDGFHVPLIIYSPLLTRTKYMAAAATHTNIPSSIVSLLQNNFGVNYPSKNTFIGRSLATTQHFNPNFSLPFTDVNRDPQYMHSGIHYYDDTFWRVINGNESERVSPSTKEAVSVKKVFENYKIIDQYVCAKNKIYPFDAYVKDLNLQVLCNQTIHTKQDLIVSGQEEYHDLNDCQPIIIPSSSIYLGFEISFKLHVNDINEAPSVVISGTKKDGSVFYERVYVNTCQIGEIDKDNYCQIRKSKIKSLKGNPLDGTTALKMYFWNHDKIDYKVRDLNFKMWIP